LAHVQSSAEAFSRLVGSMAYSTQTQGKAGPYGTGPAIQLRCAARDSSANHASSGRHEDSSARHLPHSPGLPARRVPNDNRPTRRTVRGGYNDQPD
jgi:hypothetical protein